jgi:hypothetical protein
MTKEPKLDQASNSPSALPPPRPYFCGPHRGPDRMLIAERDSVQARRIVKEWGKLDSIANFPVPEAREKKAPCSQGDDVEQDAAPAA